MHSLAVPVDDLKGGGDTWSSSPAARCFAERDYEQSPGRGKPRKRPTDACLEHQHRQTDPNAAMRAWRSCTAGRRPAGRSPEVIQTLQDPGALRGQVTDGGAGSSTATSRWRAGPQVPASRAQTTPEPTTTKRQCRRRPGRSFDPGAVPPRAAADTAATTREPSSPRAVRPVEESAHVAGAPCGSCSLTPGRRTTTPAPDTRS
jgi:hypothetical protein